MLLKALKADTRNNFAKVITEDESWYYWSYEHQSPWSTSRATVPTRTLQKIGVKKWMFTLLFSGYGRLTLNQLPKGQNLNSQYFCDVVVQETREALTSIPEKNGIEGMMIHLDDCRVFSVWQNLDQNSTISVWRE
jgi:hypothetical protein